MIWIVGSVAAIVLTLYGLNTLVARMVGPVQSDTMERWRRSRLYETHAATKK